MANKPTGAQTNLIIESLNLDKAHNYSRLAYYLKQVISGRDVTFETRSDTPITISALEAWNVIVTWSQGEGALPVGDRNGKIGMRKRASHLLDYLQTNVSGKTTEAAANYHLILDQANNPVAPLSETVGDPQNENLQKIYNLRNLQIKLQQAGLIGKIYSNLEKTKILDGVPKESRNYVIQMLAAANQNFRHNPEDATKNYTPEKIQQLLLHTPGSHDVNQIMRLLYSKSAQNPRGDFDTIQETIESTIYERHKGDEKKYQAEMDSFYEIVSMAPSLSSVSYLVNSINIGASPAEKAALIKSLRAQIISAATSSHQDGDTLLKVALKNAGFPDSSADEFKTLLPYLEEIEIKQRHLLLGSPTSKRDTRLLATLGLASDIGVDVTIPWMKRRDLEAVTAKLAGGIDLDSAQKAFDLEFAKGDSANLKKLIELSELIGKHKDFTLYQNTVSGNLGYKFQETWSKGFGNYFAIKEPIDNVTQKVWGHIENIDDVIRWPARTVANWWEKTQEEHPWLNPGALVAKKWSEYQTGIALKIHAWALKASISTAWFKSFAGHLSDYTEGFIKHDADWSRAGSFFIARKWGNTLDWATKTFTKHENFVGLKASIGRTIWDGFSKVAPGLADKMAAGAFGKVILAFIGGELTLGASIALQVGWEVVKAGFNFVGKFLTDHNFRERFINKIPLIVGGMVAGGIAFLSGLPTAIIAVAGIAGAAILAFLQAAILSLAPLFALAAAISLGAVAIVSILWFNLISPTFHLDSDTALQQVAVDVICGLVSTDSAGAQVGEPSESSSGSTTGAGSGSKDSMVSAAKCIYDFLGQFKINPLTSSNASGGAWDSFVKALGNTEASYWLQYSAQNENYLQCVGYIAAVGAMVGKGFHSGNACSFVGNPPAGYTWTTKPTVGCFFVIGSSSCSNSSPGHVGVVSGVSGAIINVLDANYSSTQWGIVRDNGQFPTSEIAGYMCPSGKAI